MKADNKTHTTLLLCARGDIVEHTQLLLLYLLTNKTRIHTQKGKKNVDRTARIFRLIDSTQLRISGSLRRRIFSQFFFMKEQKKCQLPH